MQLILIAEDQVLRYRSNKIYTWSKWEKLQKWNERNQRSKQMERYSMGSHGNSFSSQFFFNTKSALKLSLVK